MTEETLNDLREHLEGNGDNYRDFLCLLARDIKAKVIVELGTYMAITAKQLSTQCPDAKVITIDSWSDAIKFINPKPDNLEYIRGDARNISIAEKVDLLFIDVEHTYDITMGCYKAWEPLVREGGIIVFDDTDFESMKKVKEELNLIPLNEYHSSGLSCILK